MLLKKISILLVISTVSLCEGFSPYDFVRKSQNGPVNHVFESFVSTVVYKIPGEIVDSAADGISRNAKKLSADADR